MANVSFRHGIVRYQTDNGGNPTYLQKTGSYIRFNADLDPTIFVVAHYDRDYLLIENSTVNNAWGPFTTGHDYYLYWDVDFLNGTVSRGHTFYDPYAYDNPNDMPRPIKNGQHYFDHNDFSMKEKKGRWWNDVIRVFAAKYTNGTTIEPYPIGSQVDIVGNYTAGQILYDDENKPLQQWQRNRRGKFATTDTPLITNWNRVMNYRLDAAIAPALAREPIPEHYCVAWSGINPQELQLAKQDDIDHPAHGIASEDMNTGEVRSYITKGWVVNAGWEWTEDPGTPVYVGETGALVTEIPQFIAIQRMGVIVDRHTVFIDPWPQYIYDVS